MPVSEDWASIFRKETGIIVNVQGGGSTNGINQVKLGNVDIGASSRELSEEEEVGLRKIEVGKDALAIIVHPSNKLNDISSEQLRKVFSGEIKNWKELGGTDRAIQIINRESGSGTRSTFEELVMCPHNVDKKTCPQMILSAIVLNSNAEVKHQVELIDDSIAYLSFGFLDEKVKPLSFNQVEPSDKEIENGSYPLSRSLYYLVKETNSSEEVKSFLEFISSEEAESALLKEGFLPVD
jgi:phosphate transport system substrate-binding protein